MENNHTRLIRAALFSAVLAAFLFPPVAAASKAEWLPIPPEELALKAVPQSPGAHAVILYRESFCDDLSSFETHYFRIKVFDEEGKKVGDVQVPFLRGVSSVKDIRARTIRPDGSEVEWDGKALEKIVVKAGRIKVLVKAFTLPEVTAGSIVEYKYRIQYDYAEPGAYWNVEQELFTRKVRFIIRPYPHGLRCRYLHLSSNDRLAKQKDGTLDIEFTNVSSFQGEAFMPPERELRARLELYYSYIGDETPEHYWQRTGKDWYAYVQKFVSKGKFAEQLVAQTVSPTDTPETKLRKLYARAQQIRNSGFDREKTEKEENREKIKENDNIEDVVKRGYGVSSDINRLFIALARAAGLQADPVYVAARNELFFHQGLMDYRQLNAGLVMVRVGDKELYLDPAARFCPYGLLPWHETSAQGIRATNDGAVFVATPPPVSADARLERKADFTLSSDGTLEGKVQLSFFGQQAWVRRVASRNEDDTERRKDLEAEINVWIPSGATLEIISSNGWEGTGEPLRAEYKIQAAGFATPAGSRMLLPLAVTVVGQKNPFQHAQRTYPVFFSYPYMEEDEITIHLPTGYRVENLPPARKQTTDFSSYELSASQQPGTVVIRRSMVMDSTSFKVEYFPVLREFFSEVNTGDQDRAVLQSAGAAAPN